VLSASTPTAIVPAGTSGWELGVGADPARKAESDFRSRTKNPLGIKPSEATFVFVTARRWHGKAKWEAEKNALGLWRDVRVIDADSLEAWLELAPAVDTWFAKLLGKRTDGMLDLDEYWKNLAATTEPKLTPRVFLTPRRNNDVRALEQWLGIPAERNQNIDTGQPSLTPVQSSALPIESGSPSDAIDFLAAYVTHLNDKQRDILTSRIVIVEDTASWNVLCDHQHPLTLVADPSLSLEAEAVSRAVRKGHRVLLASDRFASGQSQPLKLSRPEVFELGDALKQAGFDEETARKQAFDCSGSLAVLKRRLSRVPSTTEPEWARSEFASQLAPLVLVGCWEDASSADNDAVSRILGKSYTDVASLVRHAATLRDPPLFRISGFCSLTSREDSWVLLARRLHGAQLRAWMELAVEVLTADDSQNRVPRRSKAKFQAYSETLRTGIAETLVLLAVFPTDLGTGPGEVGHIVQHVLGGNPGWKRWAALRQQLPLLAEAAPDAFLDAIESELRTAGGDVLELFADSGDPLFSQCLHSGLLWALETLAWHPSYLLRVSLVLAELSERDPGKRWSNRPSNSLSEIFLPWLAHTAARVDERIKVLRKITEKKPAAGWHLLLSLLPSQHGQSMPTHTPKWRNWATNWRAQTTDADFVEQVQACGDRLVEMAGNDTERWTDIVNHIAALPPVSKKAALSKMVALDLSMIGSDNRKTLADNLRLQIHRHRAYSEASWSLPNEDVVALEDALDRIEPDDLVARSTWLFAEYVELPEPHGQNWSWDDEQTRVSSMRQQAIAAIFAKEGIGGMLRLSAAVKAPWLVGTESVQIHLVSDPALVLPSLLVDANQATVSFAKGYAGRNFEQGGWDWIDSLRTDQWSPEQVARLATILPSERKTWSLLEHHSDDAARIYWESVYLFSIKELQDVQFAVSQLIARHRPFAAVYALRMAVRHKSDLPAALLLNALEATLEPEPDKPPKEIAFGIIELLQDLQRRDPPVDETRIARLEWAYINILDGERAAASTLHGSLARNPEFFSDLLKVVFRPRGEQADPNTEPSEEQHNRAMNAYRLLRSWDTVPGFQMANGTVDGDALGVWVERVRELCRESGYLEICDSQIGQILAHAPAESDGSWPCVAVRDAVEAINSPELANGFVVGTLNTRGVTVRRQTDGGDLERADASKYAAYAKASELEWPVTASILRRIADVYESRAGDEDEDAAIRQLGR
jgi:hypothetical protein